MDPQKIKNIKNEWDLATKKTLLSVSSGKMKKKFLGEGLSNFYVKIIEKMNPTKKTLWLDICCGSGSNSIALATNHDCFTVSFDISYKRLKIGQKIIKEYSNFDHVNLLNADLFHLPFKNHVFDGVISTQSFSPYEIEEQKKSLNELFTLLKEKGRFLMSDYNKGPEIYHLLGSKKYYEILNEIGFSKFEIQEWGHEIFAILSRFRYKILRKILLKTSNKFLHRFYTKFTRFIFKIGELENKFYQKRGVMFYIIAEK
jgi:ubiquinone/menaquinone biosynthesis C-methylase UbiE